MSIGDSSTGSEGADNPLAEITHVNYEDDEIVGAFSGFELLGRGTFEAGMRAYYLRNQTTS